MKSWAFKGMLVAAIVLPALSSAAWAGDGVTKCSLETLKGQYLVAANGTLFYPAFGVTEPSVSAAAGYSIYNGDGTGTDFVTFSINGVTVLGLVPSPTPTTYTLKPDCTGTKTVLPSGPHFNIFVAVDGDGVTAIATDAGFAVSESDRRVGFGR